MNDFYDSDMISHDKKLPLTPLEKRQLVLVQLSQLGACYEIGRCLDAGAAVNAAGPPGKCNCLDASCECSWEIKTPLCGAVMKGQVDVVRLLLARRADPNAAVKYGDAGDDSAVPVLCMATGDERIGHNLEITCLLLAAGANANASLDGRTALVLARTTPSSGSSLSASLQRLELTTKATSFLPLLKKETVINCGL